MVSPEHTELYGSKVVETLSSRPNPQPVADRGLTLIKEILRDDGMRRITTNSNTLRKRNAA